MGLSLDTFTEGAEVSQAFWRAAQEARARALQSARAGRTSIDATDRAKALALAAADTQLHRALVEAAAVRLMTAWEVFLGDLFAEFLLRRSAAFKRVWRLKRPVAIADETVELIVAQQRYPFQDFGKASDLLKRYLGDDLFGTGAHKIDVSPVQELVLVRNAVVHRAGRPTKQFRDKLGTRRTAHGYLTSRRPKGVLPPTQFERLLVGVITAAHALNTRAFQRPRP